MPSISSEEYTQAKRLLEPGSNIDDATRTELLQLTQQYDDEHLAGTLAESMNPNFSLVPQALAVQPATTHPEGDQGAQAEWMRSGGKSPNGTVVVYDVPLAQVKKDLLENPQKLRALYPNLPPGSVTPDEIMNLKPGDEIYDTYQNLTWRDTAEAAAAGGRTAYRYSKAPWLHGDGMGATVDNLGLKLQSSVQPAAEGATAFIMGVDKIANLGATRAANETLDALTGEGTEPEPVPTEGDAYVGGANTGAGSTRERNARIEDENPIAYGTGQVLAALRGWGPAGMLMDKALGATNALASKVGGNALTGAPALARGAARAGAATATGTVGAGATQAGQDVVDVAANAAQGVEGGVQLGDIPERAYEAGRSALPWSAFGGAMQSLGGHQADRIRWGDRYDGKVGRLEQDVPDMQFGGVRGPYSKAIQDAKVAARKADKQPGDMMAEPIAKPIAKVLDDDLKKTYGNVQERRDAYLKTDEAKARMPYKNFTETLVKELRADMEAVTPGGVPRPVGTADAGGELKNFLNSELEGVSLAPVEGAVAISAEEVPAFLGGYFQRQVVKQLRPEKGKGPTPTTGGGAPNRAPNQSATSGIAAPEEVPTVGGPKPPAQGPGQRRFGAKESLPGGKGPAPEKKPAVRVSGPGRPKPPEEPKARNVAEVLRRQGYDQVYLIPRRHDAEHGETLLDKIGAVSKKTNRDLAKLDHAARVDRDARPMNGKPGGWSELQQQHSEMIERSKVAAQLGAPGGDSFKVLTEYGRTKRGEAPRVDVLRDAAERAGVREQLNLIRSLDPYEELSKQSSLRPSRAHPSPTKVQGTFDALSVRSFPFWRFMEQNAGRTGRMENVGRDEAEQKRRQKELEEKTK